MYELRRRKPSTVGVGAQHAPIISGKEEGAPRRRAGGDSADRLPFFAERAATDRDKD
jgi:hypothetical protein